MNNAKERLITLITMIAIALVMIPFLCFGLGSNVGVKTAWTIEPHASDVQTGNYQTDSVIYSLSGTASNVYIYVGNVYNAPSDKIEITIVSSDSFSSIKGSDYLLPSKKVCVFEANKGEYNGWIKLNFNGTIASKYVKFSTAQSFELFEVGFTNAKGQKIDAKCEGGIVWKNNQHVFVSAEVEKNSFALTCDEQKAFNPAKSLNVLSPAEIDLSGAVDNLINFKGGYVSKSANALGVAFTSVGVLAFGNGPFGLRIVGFLFFTATLYLIFFLARKLFNKAGYGVVAVVLYLFAGIGIALVTKSSVETITTFFVLASFYFATNYHLKARDAKSARMNSNNLLLCGLMLAIALNVSFYAVLAIPAVLFVCLLPAIKAIIETRKRYIQSSGLEKEYAREKYNKTISLVVLKSIFGFVVMPILLALIGYGLAFPSYCGYYDKNLIGSMIANQFASFKFFKDGLFLAWVLGLGQATMPTPFGFNLYIIANRVLSAVSCLSVLAIGVLYVLNHANKINSGRLIVGLKDNKTAYILILSGFLSTWVLNILLLNSANYASFALVLVFAVLSLTLLYKLLSQCMNKSVLNAITIAVSILIVVCFIFQLPFTFNFDLPKDFQSIYNWLV